MVADQFQFVIGVDTHRDTHTMVVVDSAGRLLEERTVATTVAGYEQMLELALSSAPGRRLWAVEGTRSYGLGLTRFLQAQAETVCEIDVPKQAGRKRGKSDSIDAQRAARRTFEEKRLATPRADGDREALRILLLTRGQFVKWRTDATNQLENLILGLPEQLRSRFKLSGSHAWERNLKVCSTLEVEAQGSLEDRVRVQAMRDLAERALEHERAAESYGRQIKALVTKMAPALLDEPGVGPISAGQILVAWSHRGRLASEAAFATLGGTAPLEASSGTVVRHRLSRMGDRQLNQALTIIVGSRRRYHAETQVYIARRSHEHKTSKDISRCLKRYVARHLFKLVERSEA
jgi:transposase